MIVQGGVVAYPTETVWGLGCDPYSEQAVHQILELKSRPVEKGLILISGSAEHFDSLLSPLDSELRERFLQPTDVPTTWLVPDIRDQIPRWVKGQHNSVALRVSQHSVVQGICSRLGHAIVSTSANPAGLVPAKTLLDLRRYFNARLDAVIPGSLGGFNKPSMIKDLESGQIIRS